MPDPRQLLESERDETLQRLAALTDDFAGIVDASRDSNADDELEARPTARTLRGLCARQGLTICG